jgi:hypothetical protein
MSKSALKKNNQNEPFKAAGVSGGFLLARANCYESLAFMQKTKRFSLILLFNQVYIHTVYDTLKNTAGVQMVYLVNWDHRAIIEETRMLLSV